VRWRPRRNPSRRGRRLSRTRGEPGDADHFGLPRPRSAIPRRQRARSGSRAAGDRAARATNSPRCAERARARRGEVVGVIGGARRAPNHGQAVDRASVGRGGASRGLRGRRRRSVTSTRFTKCHAGEWLRRPGFIVARAGSGVLLGALTVLVAAPPAVRRGNDGGGATRRGGHLGARCGRLRHRVSEVCGEPSARTGDRRPAASRPLLRASRTQRERVAALSRSSGARAPNRERGARRFWLAVAWWRSNRSWRRWTLRVHRVAGLHVHARRLARDTRRVDPAAAHRRRRAPGRRRGAWHATVHGVAVEPRPRARRHRRRRARPEARVSRAAARSASSFPIARRRAGSGHGAVPGRRRGRGFHRGWRCRRTRALGDEFGATSVPVTATARTVSRVAGASTERGDHRRHFFRRGGTAAVAGLVLWFLSPSTTTQARWHLTPVAFAHGCGFATSAAF